MDRKNELMIKFMNSYRLYSSAKILKLLKSPIKMALPKILRKMKATKLVRAKLFFGEEMVLVLPEVVSSSLFRYGFFEPELTFVLLELLKEGMVFIDIGAHYGYYSLLARKLVGNSGEVHSFEPTPSTFSILIQNISRFGNIYANNKAVWSTSSKIKFRDYGVLYSAYNSFFAPRLPKEKAVKFDEVEIECTSLDEYVFQRGIKPDFIKIDAESAEYEILKGAVKTIETFKPIISLEVGDYIEQVPRSKQLISFLLDFGYKVYECKDFRFQEHKLQDYYNYDNLIFIP